MTSQDEPSTTTDIATAARALGVPVETLRKRLQRGTVAGFKAEDGTWRVLLDATGQPAAAPPPRRAVAPAGNGGVAAELHAMREELAALRDQVDELIGLVHRLQAPSHPASQLEEDQVRQVLLGVLQFLRRSREN